MRRPTAIYVVGLGRSGTTLLDMYLSSQSHGVVGTGEVHRLSIWRGSEHRCACGERIDDCPLWAPVLEDLDAALGPRWSSSAQRRSGLGSAVLPLLCPWLLAGRLPPQFLLKCAYQDFEPVQKACTELFKSIRKQTSASTILDSSKNIGRLLLLLRASGDDLAIIHLVRSPFEVVAAHQHHYGTGRYAALLSWSLGTLTAAAVLRIVGTDRSMQLSYEDLCSDPGRVARELVQRGWIELDEGSGDERTCSSYHQIPGNERLLRTHDVRVENRHTGLEQPSQIERWLVAPVARRYGYM
ncbi:MAG: sulfotransferase [Actinomycetia bacterium]|nr:sulfotransferase [Actinomycetes bacterium]